MTKRLQILGLASILATVPYAVNAGSASSAPRCGSHDDIAKTLASKFQENRRILGVVNSRMVMEIFTSKQGTWTVLITDTSGKSCITAAGENWQEVTAEMAGLES